MNLYSCQSCALTKFVDIGNVCCTFYLKRSHKHDSVEHNLYEIPDRWMRAYVVDATPD